MKTWQHDKVKHKWTSLNHRNREINFTAECSQVHVDYMYTRHSMVKIVFGAYTDSAGPDHPVHRAVWLQHLLFTYCILDTAGYIQIYCITQTNIRLCGFIADLDLYCSYVPCRHIFLWHNSYRTFMLFGRTCSNNVDPDQTPPNAASDLHCLHFI